MTDKLSCIKDQYDRMAQLAEGGYDESDLEDLLSLTSLVVDFCYELKTADANTVEQHEVENNCHSLFAVVDTFTHVCMAYHGLIGAVDSKIDWGVVNTSSVRDLILVTYENFATADVFLNKCRLLLDLFKMGFVYSGLVYGNPK